MRKIILFAYLGLLSGCAAQQSQSQLQARFNTENAAWGAANPLIREQCHHGHTSDYELEHPIKRGEAVKASRCTTKIFNEKIMPYAIYPDLLTVFRTNALRISDEYDSGKISSAEFQARQQENSAWYIQQIYGRLNGTMAEARRQDDITRANFQQQMQAQQQALQAQQQLQTQQQMQTLQSLQTRLPPLTPIQNPERTECRPDGYGGMTCTTYH